MKAEWVDESVFEGRIAPSKKFCQAPNLYVSAFRPFAIDRVPVEVAASVISWVADTIRTHAAVCLVFPLMRIARSPLWLTGLGVLTIGHSARENLA